MFGRRLRQRIPGFRLEGRLAFKTADAEPIAGAGQRHIEQPAMLALQFLIGGQPCGARDLGRVLAAQGKQHPILGVEQTFAAVQPARHGGGVGQDHDIGFQPLGAMHRHHPHFIAAAFHVALDLDAACFHPVQEAFQRRGMAAFMGERQTEKFLDRIGRFRAQPGKQPFAAAQCGEGVRIKLKGRRIVGAFQHLRQELMGGGEGALLRAQRLPQIAGAIVRQREDIVFPKAA